jgi:hypothetical protein
MRLGRIAGLLVDSVPARGKRSKHFSCGRRRYFVGQPFCAKAQNVRHDSADTKQAVKELGSQMSTADI